jgi:hypothetical protein
VNPITPSAAPVDPEVVTDGIVAEPRPEAHGQHEPDTAGPADPTDPDSRA